MIFSRNFVASCEKCLNSQGTSFLDMVALFLATAWWSISFSANSESRLEASFSSLSSLTET